MLELDVVFELVLAVGVFGVWVEPEVTTPPIAGFVAPEALALVLLENKPNHEPTSLMGLSKPVMPEPIPVPS